MLLKLLGLILVADGLLSFLLVKDKYWAWQVGRAVRTCIGGMLLTM